MARPSCWVVLFFITVAPLFSQAPPNVRVERAEGRILVEASDAPLAQILSAIREKLGVDLRTVGDLTPRITARVEGTKVSEIFNQLLGNRASFFMKSADRPASAQDDVEYVVVMAAASTGPAAKDPTAAQVITVGAAPAAAGAEALLVTEMEARKAEQILAERPAIFPQPAAQAQAAFQQAQAYRNVQLLGKVGAVQNLANTAQTNSIFQVSKSFQLQEAYGHYTRTGDATPLVRADQERKAIEAHQWVIQYEQMKALGLILRPTP